jgi:Eukaryotic membrane protein family
MGTIFLIYRYVLKPIDISIMYHWIRVQSMVKLYLLIAIVEVFDRLMCSLGQDCLDSLYWNTTRRPWSTRLYVSIFVVLAYTALHSVLLFVHVATLNVAMNSDDQALLSLLIGGNFAEIKSTVFKKYNKASLFKITATDICERFKLALFLFLVLMLNLSQGMDQNMVCDLLSISLLRCCS